METTVRDSLLIPKTVNAIKRFNLFLSKSVIGNATFKLNQNHLGFPSPEDYAPSAETYLDPQILRIEQKFASCNRFKWKTVFKTCPELNEALKIYSHKV